MKNLKFLFTTFAFMAFAMLLKAQDSEPTYFLVDYMKVKPGMWDKYLECEKAWKTIHQARLKAGKITGWVLYRVDYPGGTNAEYDFVTVNMVKGWNGIDNHNTDYMKIWDAAAKTMTKEQAEAANNATQYRDLIRTEVWVAEDEVFKAGESGPAKFHMVNYMKVPAGRWAEYANMEAKLVKPLHKLSIDKGQRAGWGLYSMVLPYGEQFPYGALTVDFFDKWEDVGGGGGFAEDLQKVHPGMSQAYFNRQITETRSLVRSELRVLVDYVDK